MATTTAAAAANAANEEDGRTRTKTAAGQLLHAVNEDGHSC